MKTPGSAPTTAYLSFVASMNITAEQWRDGIGFDLAALDNVTHEERDSLVQMLAERLKAHGDWRDIEALAAIGTPAAKEAIRDARGSRSAETRLYAAEQLAKMDEPADLENSIIDGLRNTNLFGGLSKALDMAEQHPSPRIQEALLDLALKGNDEQRIHCAALALYLGGKAEAAFDWNHRLFFLRFGDDDRNVRLEAYRELCLRLGVPPRG